LNSSLDAAGFVRSRAARAEAERCGTQRDETRGQHEDSKKATPGNAIVMEAQ